MKLSPRRIRIQFFTAFDTDQYWISNRIFKIAKFVDIEQYVMTKFKLKSTDINHFDIFNNFNHCIIWP